MKGHPNLFVTGEFLYSQYRNKEENTEGIKDLFLYRRIFVKSVFVRTIYDCTFMVKDSLILPTMLRPRRKRAAPLKQFPSIVTTWLMTGNFNFKFLDASVYLYTRSFPVRPSVPCYFWTTNMAVFEGEKSSNDILNNNTMSDDEVVTSHVPPRYWSVSRFWKIFSTKKYDSG